MIERCYNENSPSYYNYGQRGIVVCDRWLASFQAFYDDVGPSPGRGYSLDRIDNNGNYEPGNVRWATTKQQSRNKRTNVNLTFDSRTMTLADWAKEVGLTGSTIYYRLTSGMSVEEALTCPRRRGRRPSQSL
jgi:hypothetical protein